MQAQEVKKLTMEDVAKELGVSKSTVSRSVSGKGRIGEETRQRVLDYIAQHNYKPNVIAKGLASNRTYNIGMALPADLLSSEQALSPKLLKGIIEVAAKEEYDVILTLVERNDLSKLARVIENCKVDGMLLLHTPQDGKPVELLKKSDLPFVVIGMADDPEICQVDQDYAEACRELTSILLLKGLKKIAVVLGSRGRVANQSRLEGFYTAHKEMGIVPDESLVFTDVDSEPLAARAADTSLTRGAKCIIGGDALLTGMVKKKLEEKKICIPQDMRLASFHDSQLLKTEKSGITAIKFHTQELGREACKTLLRLMQGEDVPCITRLPYEVAMRESTK